MKDELTGKSQEEIEKQVAQLMESEDTEKLTKLYWNMEHFSALILVRQEIFEFLRDFGIDVEG